MESNNLPGINYRGHEWGALKDWLENELQDSYKALARSDIKEAEAHQMRGRILFITQMLGWPDLYAAFHGPH